MDCERGCSPIGVSTCLSPGKARLTGAVQVEGEEALDLPLNRVRGRLIGDSDLVDTNVPQLKCAREVTVVCSKATTSGF